MGKFVKEMVEAAADAVSMAREAERESIAPVPIPPITPPIIFPACEAGGEEEGVVVDAVMNVDATLVGVATGAVLVDAALADAGVGIAPEVELAFCDNIMGFWERYSRKSEVRMSKPSV